MSLKRSTLQGKVRTIITGSTGMVGEGVLHECLQHPEVEQVLVINRKPCGVTHPKLIEILHNDFFDMSGIEEQLKGYNACFFCLGVSSAGMKEEAYRHLTYDLTLHMADLLSRQNSEMVFCYVSGEGTDSSEKGRSMWARVKGKTENDLLKLPFKRAYMFRPGFIKPIKGLTQTHNYYYAINWMYPLLRSLFPKHVTTLHEVGLAMVHSVTQGYPRTHLENQDIAALAKIR
ncbi:epimerase [Paenibacillus wynnii]|uniref:Epimerase n=1 Tax=Paenibacillus wynnii TaxID=268407 RepID=A0A098M366_9BACL|nr:epimerase [Paenibacillus wynnii]KGE16940.1 epimerase [Paenibacillus wynnii]